MVATAHRQPDVPVLPLRKPRGIERPPPFPRKACLALLSSRSSGPCAIVQPAAIMRGSPLYPPRYAAVLAAAVVATQPAAAEGIIVCKSVISIYVLLAVSFVAGLSIGRK